jgi:hypothetical protein
MQILSLFVSFTVCLVLSGSVENADVDAICVIPALFALVWAGWQCRFCRYLRDSRSVWACLVGLRMQMLSLFASFPLCLGLFGLVENADFDAICVIPALLVLVWAG